MKRGFANLRTVNGEHSIGYQVLISGMPDDVRAWYPGLGPRSLRAALRARNALYEELSTGPRLAVLKTITPPEPSGYSSTGIAGIYRSTTTERSGETYAILRIRARDLATGRPTTWTRRLDHYRSERAAIRDAVELVGENVATYNAIVDRYNERRRPLILKAARREVRTLTPAVPAFYGFDLECWLYALHEIGWRRRAAA